MIVQWVANGRGIAALPSWAIADAVDKRIVCSVGLGESGLWGQLYVAVRADETERPPLLRFLELSREKSAQTLPGIQLLGDDA
jgi:LysR family transcriptional regulator for metE and metH